MFSQWIFKKGSWNKDFFVKLRTNINNISLSIIITLLQLVKHTHTPVKRWHTFNDTETTLKEDKCSILNVTIASKENKHKIGGFYNILLTKDNTYSKNRPPYWSDNTFKNNGVTKNIYRFGKLKYALKLSYVTTKYPFNGVLVLSYCRS